MTIIPYIEICSDMLQLKYSMSEKKAGFFFGLPYLMSVVLLPLIGRLSDHIGMRIKSVILSSLIFIATFTTSMLMPSCTDSCYNELYSIVLLGLGYSLYVANIFPCIPFVVEEKVLGSAYGISITMINVALSISPSIIGYLQDNTSREFGYYWVMCYFAGMNVLGLILHLIIHCVDFKHYNGILDRNAKQAKEDAKLQELPDPNPEIEVKKKLEHI